MVLFRARICVETLEKRDSFEFLVLYSKISELSFNLILSPERESRRSVTALPIGRWEIVCHRELRGRGAREMGSGRREAHCEVHLTFRGPLSLNIRRWNILGQKFLARNCLSISQVRDSACRYRKFVRLGKITLISSSSSSSSFEIVSFVSDVGNFLK